MLISHQIDLDIKAMHHYLSRLFLLLEETETNEALFPSDGYDIDARESTAKYHKFSQFIKPDMVINIYSLTEYWLKEICLRHSKIKSLPPPKKQRNESELAIHHNYLLKSGLLKNKVESYFIKLDCLRMVRNKFVHNGGHITTSESKQFNRITNITLHNSLILIDDEFIWDSLNSTDLYFKEALSI
jgi:hypothetical protein